MISINSGDVEKQSSFNLYSLSFFKLERHLDIIREVSLIKEKYMYANLLLWIVIFSRLNSVLFGLAATMWIPSVCLLVYFFIKLHGASGDLDVTSFKEEEKENNENPIYPSKKQKKWARRTVFSVIFSIFLIILAVIMPTKEEIITYVVAREVDKYNAETKTSILAPQALIGQVDNTAQGLTDIISSVRDLLESKAVTGVTNLIEGKSSSN